jgi:hypothetical protein
VTVLETDLTAIIAIRPSRCGDGFQFREKQLEHLASRLGYTVLATIDTDVIPNFTMVLTSWRPDVVITPDEDHIQLTDVRRLCDVITLNPEALYRGDRYELLSPDADDLRTRHADRPLPQRIPGASGLTPVSNSTQARAATTADWSQLAPALTGARRGRDEVARDT